MNNIICMIIFLFCSINVLASEGTSLNVITDIEFMNSSILERFTNETGIEVNIQKTLPRKDFQELSERTEMSGYDVSIVTAIQTTLLVNDNLLVELDLKKLGNIQYIDEKYLANKDIFLYSIPFELIHMGLCYNSKFVSSAEGKTYATLIDKRLHGKVATSSNARLQFFQMLQYLGYSGNSSNKEEISDAFKYVEIMRENSKIADVYQVYEMLANNEIYLTFTTGSTCYKAALLNNNIQFMLPQEGGLRTVSEMSIFKNSKKSNEAYNFINFLMRPDIAPKITEELYIATTNSLGSKLVTPSLKHNMMIFPQVNLSKLEDFEAVSNSKNSYDVYINALNFKNENRKPSSSK